MSDLEDYDTILQSVSDSDNYYHSITDSNSHDTFSSEYEQLDLNSLSISTSSYAVVDSLDAAITATRNGADSELSTLSDFITVLSQTGIHGPHLLKSSNLASRATKIGSGAQFTVFRDPMFENQVIKRLNVPLSTKGERFAVSTDYRQRIRTVGLEVLSLCNPVMRAHPNIVSLVAWGYDFPYADMPVPVLFVEAAMLPLSAFLAQEDSDVGNEVKYQLSLDVANGLEALHYLRIVHGDVKPDNVLVFAGPSDKVPFRAKLSDFGVCIDLETVGSRFSLGDYRGTPAWLAPEVVNKDLGRFCVFEADLMFKFDAYSFGMVLISVFVANGEPLVFEGNNQEMGTIPDQISNMLDGTELPPNIRMELRKAIRRLLAEDPRQRPEISPNLLKLDSPAFASWLSSIQTNHTKTPVGVIDPIYNKGPLFWYRLDDTVRVELEEQYATSKQDGGPIIPGDILFGMAQTITGAKPEYVDRMLVWLTDAARTGYSPARAVCAPILRAHGQKPEFGEETLNEWMRQAVAEGYMFADSMDIKSDDLEKARHKFRSNGGFCSDPFLAKESALEAARNPDKALQWQKENGRIVDRKGNTILHAAAAVGALGTVQMLLKMGLPVDVENNNGETPLYKAFQAGHPDIISHLLDHGACALSRTRQESITPLHWLFILPDESVLQIARRMVEGGAEINALMQPMVKENSGNYPEKIQILHYPFELPHGTAFHWACFFRNIPAMEALLSLGADINAIYHGLDASTTPLALTAYFGEPSIARYLISKGADGTMVDSKKRNTLHNITKYFPDRHGCLPHHWHYWIRHGRWEDHLIQLTEMVQILIEAGADLNAKDKSYPPLTPIAAAADLGVWDGGMICALLDAGADLKESILSAGDTVLHSWVSITGPRMDYPNSYLSTLQKISKAMPTLDIPNLFQQEMPFHFLATIYHPEDEFEAACEIFLSHNPPADINARTRRGATPLSIALQTPHDPGRRGFFLLHKGANPLLKDDQKRDIIFFLANNTALLDSTTHNLISQFLLHINPTDPHQTYRQHYLPSPGSTQALFAAAERGKPRTLAFLLDLGLAARINELNTDKSPPQTALDHALKAQGYSQREHTRVLELYKPGPAQKQAIAANLVYDEAQGPPARAAEAHRCFPEVVEILRAAGAKQMEELDSRLAGMGMRTVRDQIGSVWNWMGKRKV